MVQSYLLEFVCVCLDSLNENQYIRKSVNNENECKTYMYHIITNLTKNKFNDFVLDVSFSDHRAVLASIDLETNSKNKRINIQVEKHVMNYDNILNSNASGDIISINTCEELVSRLQNNVNENTTKKKIRKRERRISPWANNEFCSAVNKRDFFL